MMNGYQIVSESLNRFDFQSAMSKWEPVNLDVLWSEANNLMANYNKKYLEAGKQFPFFLGKIIDPIENAYIQIYIVDGDTVAKKYDMEFLLGGHDKIYDYIPPKTIWLDGQMEIDALIHILYHECLERMMMKHAKLSYDEAHEIANREEKKRIDV